MQSCPDCFQYQRSANQLEAALRRNSKQSTSEPSPMLEQRILVGVRRSAALPERSNSTNPVYRWIPGFAGVLAAGCLAVWLSGGPSDHTTKLEDQTVRAPLSVTDVIAEAPTAIEVPEFQTLVPLAIDLLDVVPLEEERQAVLADARAALRFLASPFLSN